MNQLLTFLPEPDKAPEPETCGGLIFRYRSTYYWNGKQYVERAGMNLLKRKSCKGCPKCYALLDDLQEFSSGSYAIQPVIPKDPVEAGLYALTYQNISHDWETGYVDDYELHFTKYEEPEDGC